MKSSSALTAAKTVIRWLRWAAVLTLVCSVWGGFICSTWKMPVPAPLAVVETTVFMLGFHLLLGTAFVAAGALIAPWARRGTAIVLAAVYVPLSFWTHLLSRVTLVELVLLQGPAAYGHFVLETLGAVLGVVWIFRSEKARTAGKCVPPSPSLEAPSASAGPKATPTAAKSVICSLRWAVVLALVCSTLGELIYSALGELAFSELGPQARNLRPAALAVAQQVVGMLLFFVLRQTAFVVAGALIAPRIRLAIAIVLAAGLVSFSFWAHVLATGGPWPAWTINYTHFSLEAFGAVLGVAYVFWSERMVRRINVP